MGKDKLIADIKNGTYEYMTMLYTNLTYSIVDNKNKVIKTIPNPMVMSEFFKQPTKMWLSDDGTLLFNERGGEAYLSEERIVYENGELRFLDPTTNELQCGWVLSKTSDFEQDNSIDYDRIINDLRADSRKHVK